ncbi:MAG: hypothetical protein KDD02_18860 [Phaeodactylibacter sp.]|nr:hypothetical protein [Phaeodactylibacter sp.]
MPIVVKQLYPVTGTFNDNFVRSRVGVYPGFIINRRLLLSHSPTLELHADLIVIDEAKGRSVAKVYGIKGTGLLGVLMEAPKG